MCSGVFYWMRRLRIRLPSELQGDRSIGPWRCCLSSATHSKPGSGSQINSSLLTCASHFADYIVDRHEKRQLCWARQAFSAFDSGKNLFGFALTQSPFLQNFCNLLRRNLTWYGSGADIKDTEEYECIYVEECYSGSAKLHYRWVGMLAAVKTVCKLGAYIESITFEVVTDHSYL